MVRVAARHIPELDGVRGLAILLVLGCHFLPAVGDGVLHGGFGGALRTGLSFGWVGVDLFFVLSGFLITGILLDSRESPYRARSFYSRRCLRILPLYYAALIVFFSLVRAPFGDQIWWWAHLSNWGSAAKPLAYPHVTHFWSLAIEEQFYLAWPLIVWRLTPRRLLHVAIIGAAGSLLLRNALAFAGLGEHYLYRWTPFRLDGLLLGAVVALAYRDARLRDRLARYIRPTGSLAFAAFIATGAFAVAYPHSLAMPRVGYFLIAVACAALVFHAVFSGAASFRWSLLRTFGKYSYFIYVTHWAIYSFTLEPIRAPIRAVIGDGGLAAIISGGLCLGLMVALGACSWYLFESRMLAMAAISRAPKVPLSITA